MDDQEFDKRIKQKADDYHAAGFDPAALSALHHRMDAEQVWPWYSRYKSELIISSVLLLSTLSILLSQWNVKTRVQVLEDEILSLQKQNQMAYDLQNEIDLLKSIPPDTIRIVEVHEGSSSLNSVLIQKITELENTVANLSIAKVEYLEASRQNSISLSEQNIVPSHEDYPNSFTNTGNTRVTPRASSAESFRAVQNNSSQHIVQSPQKLSAKKLRELEKHYQKGIGIRVGPTVEISRGIYGSGVGRFDIGGGMIGDFILSPSISLETGVKYAHRFYEISGEEHLYDNQLPGTDENLGTLVNADVDSWSLEIPLNLKYRYPLSPKSQLIAGLGYSSLIYTKQIFEYEYEFEANSPVSLGISHEETAVKVSPGTLNILLGVNHELKNRKNLETSLYYQYGLGNMGAENNRASFIGLRGVYWFTVR